MPEGPPISVLDARLAEIDRRLATIQTDLAAGECTAAPATAAPEATLVTRLPPRVEIPGPSAPPNAPATPAQQAAGLIAQLRELTEGHARLLQTMRELVAAWECAPAGPTPAPELRLSAGPLTSTEALREFERRLSRLPEVRGVEVRGYQGEDRAILDVHLVDLTS